MYIPSTWAIPLYQRLENQQKLGKGGNKRKVKLNYSDGTLY